MANRVKEDEKNERIIRSLLKLTENRRCFNCNSWGPQYVCTNFSTFICTTCSGIHREFTHRVKSVSMAKFTSQEVSALQGGGNASAKEIYLKEWDPQRHSVPDSSNGEKLRDFIKQVYVNRRYMGERSFDEPPMVKMINLYIHGESEDLNKNRSVGSRSPPYEDTYERRYSDRPSPGGRSDDKNYRTNYDERGSPGSDSDYRRCAARTDIVNEWRREDIFGNGRRSDESRISDGGSKLEGRSPDCQSDRDISSPPVVRPVRDILRENVSPLRIIEPPKANGGRSTDASEHTQRNIGTIDTHVSDYQRMIDSLQVEVGMLKKELADKDSQLSTKPNEKAVEGELSWLNVLSQETSENVQERINLQKALFELEETNIRNRTELQHLD